MGLILRLALADLRHRPVLALCAALGLAAVLAPLVLLAGLRAGVLAGLREGLLADPRATEIVTIANREFAPDLLATLAARPDVGFWCRARGRCPPPSRSRSRMAASAGWSCCPPPRAIRCWAVRAGGGGGGDRLCRPRRGGWVCGRAMR